MKPQFLSKAYYLEMESNTEYAYPWIQSKFDIASSTFVSVTNNEYLRH